ncbi:MAG: hypothetical protein ACFFB3_22565 [Candidatus Hodarchaeota archaeon]
MSEYEICRLCGFVRKAGEKGGICQLCGAPATAFISYKHKASEIRRRYLELDVHPVAVHFSISYTISMAILFILSFITPELFGIHIRDDGLLDFFVILFPIFALGGGATGIIDGKARYRKLRTPYLKLKIVMGIAFLLVSIAVFIAHFTSNGGDDALLTGVEGLLIAAAVLLASALGWYGTKLVGFIVPRGAETR